MVEQQCKEQQHLAGCTMDFHVMQPMKNAGVGHDQAWAVELCRELAPLVALFGGSQNKGEFSAAKK